MSGRSPVNDRIPVAPLREAFEASGLTPSQVCRRLGWMRRLGTGSSAADTARLRRALGQMPSYNPSRRAYSSYATRIGYDHALKIAEAIGVDPVDVGL